MQRALLWMKPVLSDPEHGTHPMPQDLSTSGASTVREGRGGRAGTTSPTSYSDASGPSAAVVTPSGAILTPCEAFSSTDTFGTPTAAPTAGSPGSSPGGTFPENQESAGQLMPVAVVWENTPTSRGHGAWSAEHTVPAQSPSAYSDGMINTPDTDERGIAQTLIVDGQHFLMKGYLPEAVEAFYSALSHELPESQEAAAIMGLAEAHLEGTHYEECLEAASMLRGMGYTSEKYFHLHASALTGAGRFDDAAAIVLEGIERYPQSNTLEEDLARAQTRTSARVEHDDFHDGPAPADPDSSSEFEVPPGSGQCPVCERVFPVGPGLEEHIASCMARAAGGEDVRAEARQERREARTIRREVEALRALDEAVGRCELSLQQFSKWGIPSRVPAALFSEGGVGRLTIHTSASQTHDVLVRDTSMRELHTRQIGYVGEFGKKAFFDLDLERDGKRVRYAVDGRDCDRLEAWFRLCSQ